MYLGLAVASATWYNTKETKKHIKHRIWQCAVNILIRLLPCKEVL